MIVPLDPSSIRDYRKFLEIKQLPKYRVFGGFAEFPDEYAGRIGIARHSGIAEVDYKPTDGGFDYQVAISHMAIKKRKFAVFADCGLGKTWILFDYALAAAGSIGKKSILIVSPSMVVPQTIEEWTRFHPKEKPIRRIRAHEISEWAMSTRGEIAITNYEAMSDDIDNTNIGALILDESSMLKSHYGNWGSQCIRLGRGLDWKLCLTGTPAPNDRIEYANHAVFLDHFPNVNSFLARFFVNRGQTNERWELKPHALKPFYHAISHWCIFLTNPATYGWKDNATKIPPIRVHIHEIPMTREQRDAVGDMQGTMFVDRIGGIGTRQKLGRLAKGEYNGQAIATNKTEYIKSLVDTFPKESAIVWCIYNAEQDAMENAFPGSESIRGETDEDDRIESIGRFKAGTARLLISKPKILGFGLNLQVATRQIFSGLQDSYESYYQAVKRSNRVGSTKPLDVHIPITEIEAPMVENVLRKAKQIESDTKEQEEIFRAYSR